MGRESFPELLILTPSPLFFHRNFYNQLSPTLSSKATDSGQLLPGVIALRGQNVCDLETVTVLE